MKLSSRIRSLASITLFSIQVSCQLGNDAGFALAFSPQQLQRTTLRSKDINHDFKNKYLSTCDRTSLERPTRLQKTELKNSVVLYQSSAYLGLLAIQFGCQPILTKSLVPKSIVRSTVLLAQDTSKILLCFIMLVTTGDFHQAIRQWTLKSALMGAGIPSILYLIQNYCSLIAYQNLPPVTYNILNQTKTLSAALCCFLVMGKRQSPLQIVSLLVLLFSALVLEGLVPLGLGKAKKADSLEAETSNKESEKANLASGVLPILVASFISGLAGALTQKTLQLRGINTYVLSMELSIFSILMLFASLFLGSPDGKRLREDKVTVGWTRKTWIPVVTNAAGGLLVGLVTKHSGVVRKGFALIFGLVLSGILQTIFSESHGTISMQQIAGGILASISLWMHSAFPP